MNQDDIEAKVRLLLSFQLHQLAQKLSNQARTIIARHDPTLTLAQWRIMRVIGLGEAEGSTTVRRISGIDKGQFSKSVAQLTQRGLLQSADHPQDRRQSLLILTETGQALYDTIGPTLTQRNKMLLAALPPKQRVDIYDAITALSAASETTEF